MRKYLHQCNLHNSDTVIKNYVNYISANLPFGSIELRYIMYWRYVSNQNIYGGRNYTMECFQWENRS